MLVYSFATGVSIAVLDILASSLFIAEFGAGAIPYTYIIAGLVVPLCGSVYTRFEARLPVRRLMCLTLALLFVVTLGFQIGIWLLEARWLLFALPVWFRLVYGLISLAVWGVANSLFTLQQGKRLFGLIGAGDMTAVVLASFAMPLLVQFLGTANVLLVVIGSLGLSLGIVSVILTRFGQPSEARQALHPAKRPPAREILANRYAVLISVIAGLSILGH